MKANPYWIPGPWTGRLAILPRPRGKDWLGDEIRSWRAAGIDVAVSFLTPAEVVELSLEDEAMLCEKHGIAFYLFSIPDRSVPVSREATVELARKLERLLNDGKHVGMHCRQGLGRPAIVAGCLLIASGITASESFRRIGVARGTTVPETREQREWVESLSSELLATNVAHRR